MDLFQVKPRIYYGKNSLKSLKELDISRVFIVTDENMVRLKVVNNMLIDLLATMARLDNDKRRERIKQGLERSGYKPSGKKADTQKHNRRKTHKCFSIFT